MLLILVLPACTKKSETPQYKKGSKEYIFFKTLSEKAPFLDPDIHKLLIATKKFTIQNLDLMPRLYSISRRQPSFLQNAQKDVLVLYLQQLATQEAEKRLLLVSARDNGIKASKDSVEKQLKTYSEKQGGKEAYLNYIAEYGLTLDLVRQDIQNGLTVDQLIKRKIFKNLEVSDDEIITAYEQEKYVTLRQIVMSVAGKTPSEIEVAQKKMEALRARALKGDSFAKLAEEYSEDKSAKGKGGLHENVPRHVMLASFEKAIFALPIGGISEVMKTHEGLFLIRVEKRSRESKPLDQVKDNLKTELLQMKQRSAYTAYIDSLKMLYRYEDRISQAL